MVLQTRSAESKKYRDSKIASMGLQAFKNSEALKRKLRRQRHRTTTTTTEPQPIQFEIKEEQQEEQEEEKQTTDTSLDAIYEAKLAMAKRSNHTIKKSSVATTLNRVKKLHQYMYDSQMSNFDWVTDTNKVSDFILTSTTWKTNESKIQQYQSLASILKVLKGFENSYKIYSEKSIEMRQIQTKLDDKNELSEKEAANMMAWTKIKKIKGDNTHDIALIGVYVDIPPRRLLDYSLMKITTTDTDLNVDFNYVVLVNNKPVKFIFNNYKTSSKFGKQEFKIPSTLSKKLNTYITESSLVDGDFLFGRTKTSPYTSFSNQVSKLFKKYTGKLVSVNILRHSFITWYLKKKNLTLANRKAIAYAMSHSIDMQLQYNRVNSDN
jgi:hypothetical protein